ncbi:ABC transporter permease [Longispora fulva]|uniref:Peptide/nickel transport system permease protein n=1 Tax=Longispora fulva TaxID=619741 RepID=A0A8J7GHV2_9ACTN|nr:ABC transporter permease [Longispora fulva]MBG6137045.1 peptide/nickel transport system permease protein [Longispora fulva]GIG61601.1 ABC transporter permease [Longispora fulva]
MTTTIVNRRPGFGRLRTRRPWLYLTCLAFAALVFLVAVAAPWLAPADPNAADLGAALTGPSPDHLLGADEAGRDVLSRLILGARTALFGPLGVVVFSTVLGVAVGVAAGWRGGWLDSVLSRGSELLLAFPGLLLAILFVALYGDGLLAPVLALSLAYLPYVSRLARSMTLVERERPYLAAYRVQGFSGLSICLRHLVPNIAPVVLAQCTLNFGYALLDLAALSYLGLGVAPLTPDWGMMVNTGQSAVLQGQPLSAIIPGAAIVATVVAFNVVGEHWADKVARRHR